MQAKRRMEFIINYGMLAPLVILVITLCTITIATPCPFLLLARRWTGHSFRPRWLSCQCTHIHPLLLRYTLSLRHADKSFLMCNSNACTPTSSLCIYQCMNCSGQRTGEGHLKMHRELDKQASAGFSHGELRQKDRETHGERGRPQTYKVSLRNPVLVLTLCYRTSQTHLITHTKTHTQTHCGMTVSPVPCRHSDH